MSYKRDIILSVAVFLIVLVILIVSFFFIIKNNKKENENFVNLSPTGIIIITASIIIGLLIIAFVIYHSITTQLDN